jgi:hypothetical protein
LLRQRALDSKKSFNQVALEALAAGVGQSTVPKRDYSEIAGSLSDEEAEQIEQDIRSQNQVDAELWK